MHQELSIIKTTIPETRLADYCLACLGGSVFIDFNLSQDGLIYLQRMSFDGYGCCDLHQKAIPLDRPSSDLFQQTYQQDAIDQRTMTRLIHTAIELNKSHLWEGALKEYCFLK